MNPLSVPIAHPTQTAQNAMEHHSVTGVPRTTSVIPREIHSDVSSVHHLVARLPLKQRSVSISETVRVVQTVRGSVTGALKIMALVMPRDRGVDVLLVLIALRLNGVND